MAKLSPYNARRFFRSPDPARGSVLIYSPNPGLAAYFSRMTVDTLAGETGRAEMRVSETDPDTILTSADALLTLLKARSFFSGRRVVHLGKADDSVTNAVSKALDMQEVDDAFLVVTAGNLGPKSRLRKFFEAHRKACSAPVYANAASAGEIRELAAKAGIRDMEPGAVDDLSALGREMPPSELGQMLEKLALYKGDDRTPVSPADVQACAPSTGELLIDRLLEHVVDRQPSRISPALRQISGREQNPVAICIRAQWLFRRIHQVASDPDGPGIGIAKLRPPVFSNHRDRMIGHARMWGMAGAEDALRELLATDRALRSGRKFPQQAYVERALIRVAMARSG